MAEQTACSSFSQHAWKKDLCVNCGRLRSVHADIPTPAKRLSKGKEQIAEKYGEPFLPERKRIVKELRNYYMIRVTGRDSGSQNL